MAITDKKLRDRQALLATRTSQLQACTLEDGLVLARTPTDRCLRLNPLKAEPANTYRYLTDAGLTLHQPDWLPEACYLISASQTSAAEAALQQALTTGAAYLQNPSSFVPVRALEPAKSEVILDLCAAPGGKASCIAALTDNQAELWVNDTSYDRVQRLKRVCSLLNVKPAQFTMVAGEQAAKKLPLAYFTKILIDAPCSGEDIRLLTERDLGSWSPAKVKRLAELQKKLLKEAWKLLQPGGQLVYSTCSQAPEENEQVLHWFLAKHDDATIDALPAKILPPNSLPGLVDWQSRPLDPSLALARRIPPSETHIAFFICSIRKLMFAPSD